jgi:hypothetical protein
MNKTNVIDRFFLEIDKLADGRMKVCKAKRLISLNQYKRTWERLDSRELARKINKSTLVIK